MILIGLTGGIACGKSTVSDMIHKEYNVRIIDADQIVHALQAPNTRCTRKIAQRWPRCVNAETGVLDRAALGKVVFEDPAARRALGDIMNMPIFFAITTAILREWWRQLRGCNPPGTSRVVILDAPTLFETKTFTYVVSDVLVVACSEDTQVARLNARNHLDREAAQRRIRSQMPLEKKRRLAGYVIENDNIDQQALREKVAAAMEWINQQSNQKISWIVGAVLAAGVATTAVIAALLLKAISL